MGQDRKHASDVVEIKMMNNNNNDAVTACAGVWLCRSVILTRASLIHLAFYLCIPAQQSTICQQRACISQTTSSSGEK